MIAMSRTYLWSVVGAVLLAVPAFSQPGVLPRDLIVKHTPEWKGERFAADIHQVIAERERATGAVER